jgi:hypothetical protein
MTKDTTACIEPGRFEDWEFESFLAGDDVAQGAALAQHIAVCQHCAAKLRDMRHEQTQLSNLLSRFDCLPAEKLLAYRWGQLAPTEADAVSQHVKTCAACANELAQLMGPLPAHAARHATHQQTAPNADSLLNRVGQRLAVLAARIFTPPPELMPVVRGGGDANAADAVLNFAIADRDWEVTLTPTKQAAGILLSGQLLGPQPEELRRATATLLANNEFVTDIALDESGWFELPVAKAATYQLWFDLPNTRITIDELKLG